MNIKYFHSPIKYLILTSPGLILLFLLSTASIFAQCTGVGVGTGSNPLGVICPPDGVPTEASSIGSIINLVIKILMAVGFLLAFIYLLLGGISYITSNGEPAKTAAAQRKIIYAVIGVVVVALSFAILTLVENITGAPVTSPQLPF